MGGCRSCSTIMWISSALLFSPRLTFATGAAGGGLSELPSISSSVCDAWRRTIGIFDCRDDPPAVEGAYVTVDGILPSLGCASSFKAGAAVFADLPSPFAPCNDPSCAYPALTARRSRRDSPLRCCGGEEGGAPAAGGGNCGTGCATGRSFSSSPLSWAVSAACSAVPSGGFAGGFEVTRSTPSCGGAPSGAGASGTSCPRRGAAVFGRFGPLPLRFFAVAASRELIWDRARYEGIMRDSDTLCRLSRRRCRLARRSRRSRSSCSCLNTTVAIADCARARTITSLSERVGKPFSRMADGVGRGGGRMPVLVSGRVTPSSAAVVASGLLWPREVAGRTIRSVSEGDGGDEARSLVSRKIPLAGSFRSVLFSITPSTTRRLNMDQPWRLRMHSRIVSSDG
eukprot:Opistho-1_new@79357